MFYIGRIEIISGFDGVIPEPNDGPDEIIHSVLEEISGKTEKELEDDVYEKIELVLCSRCRQKLRNCINLMTSP